MTQPRTVVRRTALPAMTAMTAVTVLTAAPAAHATPAHRSIRASVAATATSLSTALEPKRHRTIVRMRSTVVAVTGLVTGAVTFTDNGHTIKGCKAVPLRGSVTATAACKAVKHKKGIHRFEAHFLGDAAFAPSVSLPFAVQL